MPVQDILNSIIDIRRELHCHPELSFKEYATTQFIEKTLQQWGIEFHRFNHLETGGYCKIGKGETVAFRADIDALPIEENPDHTFRSNNPGIMHACGHDFHTAIGLGLAKYFATEKKTPDKRLLIIFQPGEEAAPGGAELVIKEKFWREVSRILSVHVMPGIPVGKFIVNKSAVQASSTSIYIELYGPGGHTSKPSETADLINIGASFITQLQSQIRQRIHPQETVVLVFASIHGGNSHNIIPQKLELRGTLRTLNNSVLDEAVAYMQQFAKSYANLYGIRIDLQFPTNCPATVNDAGLYQNFIDFMNKEGQSDRLILDHPPSMGADDFAFYAREVPGLYLIAGGGGSGILHSSNLLLDEALLLPVLETISGFISYM